MASIFARNRIQLCIYIYIYIFYKKVIKDGFLIDQYTCAPKEKHFNREDFEKAFPIPELPEVY